jgi:hypothetical protein
MAEELDLSDIDPLKWAEARRRVGVIKRYLAIPRPTGADRDRHAAELGLQTGQFYNLVRAWREHRKASVLTYGARKASRPSRSRRGGVDPQAREIARAVIADLGRDAPIRLIETATVERCATEGVKPPSRGTMRLLAKEAGVFPGDMPTTGIFVARTFVRLPTILDGAIELPAAVLAAEAPGGRILALALAEPGSDDAIDRIAEAIRARLDGSGLPVAATEADADLLEAALPGISCVRETNPVIDLMLASTVGRRVGHIELRVRRPTTGPKPVMQSVRDVALSQEDAELALNIAVANHNRAIAGDGSR